MGIQKNREREREMEVEVKTGGYHFIQFHAHITHEHLFKGT
jgi:carbonic anhydrase